jgi:hypothetical protein
MAGAVGMRVGDFTSGALPMALELDALPCSPEELVGQEKKITHSVRRWKHLGEAEIRQFFRERRGSRKFA